MTTGPLDPSAASPEVQAAVAALVYCANKEHRVVLPGDFNQSLPALGCLVEQDQETGEVTFYAWQTNDLEDQP